MIYLTIILNIFSLYQITYPFLLSNTLNYLHLILTLIAFGPCIYAVLFKNEKYQAAIIKNMISSKYRLPMFIIIALFIHFLTGYIMLSQYLQKMIKQIAEKGILLHIYGIGTRNQNRIQYACFNPYQTFLSYQNHVNLHKLQGVYWMNCLSGSSLCLILVYFSINSVQWYFPQIKQQNQFSNLTFQRSRRNISFTNTHYICSTNSNNLKIFYYIIWIYYFILVFVSNIFFEAIIQKSQEPILGLQVGFTFLLYSFKKYLQNDLLYMLAKIWFILIIFVYTVFLCLCLFASLILSAMQKQNYTNLLFIFYSGIYIGFLIYQYRDRKYNSQIIKRIQKITFFQLQNLDKIKKQISIQNQQNKDHQQLFCSICKSQYLKQDKLIIQLICKHKFHFDCVLNWLIERATCPYCRAHINIFNENKQKRWKTLDLILNNMI